jgi:hypothetical protein
MKAPSKPFSKLLQKWRVLLQAFPNKSLGIISLTPHPTSPSIDAVDSVSAESAGAPANDMKITPAMVEAGVEEIASFNLDFESREEAVIRIYRRMRSEAYDLLIG